MDLEAGTRGIRHYQSGEKTSGSETVVLGLWEDGWLMAAHGCTSPIEDVSTLGLWWMLKYTFDGIGEFRELVPSFCWGTLTNVRRQSNDISLDRSVLNSDISSVSMTRPC